MKDKWTHLILMVLIVTVCFLVFYKMTGFDFTADDWRLIYEKRDFLQNWGNLKTVLTQPFPAETYEPIPYYRPVVTLVNMLNHHLLGKTTFGYHIVNLGLHALNAVLLYLILLVLFKRELLSFLAALFFSAHPIHATSVVWVSGRTDLIACFFVLLSVLLFYKRKDHYGASRLILYWGAVVAFLLALFSKEMALALPLFLLVWEYVSSRYSTGGEVSGREKPAYPALIPFFAAAVLYLIIRISVIGNLGTGEPYASANLFERFLTMFGIYFYYFREFVLPVSLNFSPRVLTITSILSLKFWGALLVFAVVLALGLSLRRSSKGASFGILWMLVALVPVLNLVPLYASVKEWWAYIPSIGFCLLLGRVAEIATGWERKLIEIRLRKRTTEALEPVEAESGADEVIHSEEKPAEIRSDTDQTGMIGEKIQEVKAGWLPGRVVLRMGHVFSLFFALVLLFYAFQTQSGASIFRKDYYLWRDTSKAAPYDATAHQAFGNILQRKGVVRWAKEAFQKAVQADPSSAEARNQLGMTLETLNQDDSARVQIREALKLKPDFAEAYNNLGILYGKEEDYDSALIAFHKALEIDSTFFHAWRNTALIYYDQERPEEAFRYFESALRFAPNQRDAEGIQTYLQQLRVEGWGY